MDSIAENAKFIPKWEVHAHQRSNVSCKISNKNVAATMSVFYLLHFYRKLNQTKQKYASKKSSDTCI